MATITLSPGERFEHYHQEVTVSTLVDGKAVMDIDGTQQVMKTGKEMLIPAGTKHAMINSGEKEAKITCNGH